MLFEALSEREEIGYYNYRRYYKFIPNVNVADLSFHPSLAKGNKRGVINIFAEIPANYRSQYQYVWHRINSDMTQDNCIHIHLNAPYKINTINMILWNNEPHYR